MNAISALDISALAKRHKIADSAMLRRLIEDAAQCYESTRWTIAEGYDGPDTLNKVEKPASALLDLLANEVNRHRLLVNLIGVKDGYATNDLAFATKLDQLPAFLEAVRLAAREAHRTRPRKRPKSKADLTAAYAFLVKFWPAGATFSNTWDDTDRGSPPIPTSPAAWFLYDAMKLIDPNRKRLAEELRDLMAETVTSLPGPRRGRRNLG